MKLQRSLKNKLFIVVPIKLSINDDFSWPFKTWLINKRSVLSTWHYRYLLRWQIHPCTCTQKHAYWILWRIVSDRRENLLYQFVPLIRLFGQQTTIQIYIKIIEMIILAVSYKSLFRKIQWFLAINFDYIGFSPIYLYTKLFFSRSI